MLANGGFESDTDADGRPDRWRLRRLDPVDDGQICNGGGCGLLVHGDAQRNEALQTILASGDAGDTVTFSAEASGKNVPAAPGKFQVELSLIHADGSKQRKTLKFDPGSVSDQQRSKAIVATEPFVRLKVRVEYGRASGVVRVDGVSVVLE